MATVVIAKRSRGRGGVFEMARGIRAAIKYVVLLRVSYFFFQKIAKRCGEIPLS